MTDRTRAPRGDRARALVRHRLAATADAARRGRSLPWPHRPLTLTSMLRYYMTAETRQSLIEESNRQIAMRAIASAARGRRIPAVVQAHPPAVAADFDAAVTDWAAAVSESAFARLVAELEATSQAPASGRPQA